ncbi:phosphate ABC transporter substrate-binding protein [Janthinobacterium sp.]|uniref:phosphate ABC transporter substrate-binding protein n=1 Tax=Janthinobacterium sp. TaxID=1871054 RepID=UPI00293D901B|nr:phosphate ABC transporter substrate-binding protein [Janthinobacterium sp.]
MRPYRLAALAAFALGAVTARAEVVVIVSAKCPTSSLSVDQAADIFLGKFLVFPGGAAAVPIDQNEGSALRDEFYRKSSGKAAPQMLAHWAKMIFTGRGQPPVESGDSAAVRRLVAENPNLIGYIDRSMVNGSVKVVLTLR